MQVELTEVDINNVRVALLQLAKHPSSSEEVMRAALNLLDKFVVKPEPKSEEELKKEVINKGEK